jgi:hypothetical protein
MPQIKVNEFKPRPIYVCSQIWNPDTKQVVPIQNMDDVEMYDVLDSITLALEAGVLDSFRWPQQIFAKRAVFDSFLEYLTDYDECYRITDQWWRALAALCEVIDEEGFVSTREIANELRKHVYDHGMADNFGRKKPKYLHSEMECIEAEMTLEMFRGAEYSRELVPDAVHGTTSDVASYGRFHETRATEAQLTSALEQGRALLKAQKDAKKAAAKAAKEKKATAKAAPKVKKANK